MSLHILCKHLVPFSNQLLHCSVFWLYAYSFTITFSSSDSPLCSSITPSLFHSRLKTYVFHKSYPRSFTSSSQTAFTHFCLHRLFLANWFLFFSFSLILVSVPCTWLSWPYRQLLSAPKYIVSYHIVSYAFALTPCFTSINLHNGNPAWTVGKQPTVDCKSVSFHANRRLINASQEAGAKTPAQFFHGDFYHGLYGSTSCCKSD